MAEIYKGMDEEELDEDEREKVIDESKLRLNRIKPLKQPIQQIPKQPIKPKKRYAVFNTPANVGIGDTETGQVVVDGDLGIFQALAEILEKLERIEYKIGNILEG